MTYAAYEPRITKAGCAMLAMSSSPKMSDTPRLTAA